MKKESVLFWGIVLVIAFAVWKINIHTPTSEYYIRDTIEETVAKDAVRQYMIAERQGDKMQMYVQAGICSAAFLQAEDEQNYRKWKEVENNLARQIGLPHY